MIYTPKTKIAMKLCFDAHKDQTDKNGLPYVFHPFHLAEQMQDETTTIVALLHDVAEDTDISLEKIWAMKMLEEKNMAFSLTMNGEERENELQVLKKISHPNFPRIVDAFEEAYGINIGYGLLEESDDNKAILIMNDVMAKQVHSEYIGENVKEILVEE